MLHLGSARTALFNWLYARHHGGRFLLRIEDTDRKRSTEPAVQAILDGLRWLGLDWDGEPLSQASRVERHAEIARRLLAEGKAYNCYCTPEELEEMRRQAVAEGRPTRYDGRWRDRDPADAPPDVKPAIRLKVAREGETRVADLVQGEVVVQNEHIDDMVLLRGDGTPVYMLAVVVDDHDMAVSHIIRGDDHLTNAVRQQQIYRALDWPVPAMAHIPLIHGADGAKLSKRHGALGVDAYRDMGYLPEAMRNYLLRLGWSHGDDEIISTEQATAWFSLDTVGRSPARFDFAKLDSLNAHYLKLSPDGALADLVAPRLAARLDRPLTAAELARVVPLMGGLKERARTLADLAENAWFLVAPRPLSPDDKAAKLLGADAVARLDRLAARLRAVDAWTAAAIEAVVRQTAEAEGAKLGQLAQPLRAALTGRTVSPGIFEVVAALGKAETLERLNDCAGTSAAAP